MSGIHRPGRMPRWQRWGVTLGMSACALSGLLFLLGQEFDVASNLLGGRYMLTVHGVSANLAVFLFGTVVVGHVRVGLSFRRQLFTGISNLLALSVLMVSSWLLYYGSEAWRDDTVCVHWVVGLLFIIILFAHLMPWLRSAVFSTPLKHHQ